MKKTFVQLLILIICFTAAQQSFGQKRKYTKVDTFYFETPNTQKNTFQVKSNDSLSEKKHIYISTFSNTEVTDFSLTRAISLIDNSGSKTISIEINDGSPEFLLSIDCNLQKGSLDVEIYDPKGTKRGNFSVKGSGHSNSKSGWHETVGSVINKRYLNPLKGTWSLKFVAKKVTADIMIKTKIK